MGKVQRDADGNRIGRYAPAYNADGTPKYLHVYDGGADCLDRYTAAFTRTKIGHNRVPYLAVTEHGATYHGEMPARARPGRLVSFSELNAAVQRAIMADYKAWWG